MTCVPKRPPGSPSASEEDEPEGTEDTHLKSDTSENRDEHSLVGFFFCFKK